MSCQHTSWIRLSKRDYEVKLHITDRPSRLVNNVGDPDNETPSLVVLVGNQQKATALEQLGIKQGKPHGHRAHGEMHLSVAPSNKLHSQPVFIADCDVPLHNRLGHSRPQRCHETAEHVLPADWRRTRQTFHIAQQAYQRVVFPFVDVICLFIDDLGGIEEAARWMSAWLDRAEPSTRRVLPQLVLITDGYVESLDCFANLAHLQSSVNLYSHFVKVHTVSLSTWWHLRRCRKRRDRSWCNFVLQLRLSLEQMQKLRLADRSLYSATHFVELMNYAAKDAVACSGPFNFVKASRTRNCVSGALQACLSHLLKCVNTLDELQTFAIPLIASSLILDQYPPGMHVFPPRAVFAALYRQVVIGVCQEGRLVLPSMLAALVERQLDQQFDEYILSGMTSRDWHYWQLSRHRLELTALRSDEACFSCLNRVPMYTLPCGHSICQECVRIFGSQSRDTFRLECCLLCGKETMGFCIRVKPDTATVRVLSVDGGGTRARVPLAFLEKIQDCVGLPYAVQQNFDVVFGTSSGAISVCGLCINGWPVEDCIASSEALGRLAFQPRQISQLPLAWIPPVHSFWELLLSLVLDSRYPSKSLENMLKKLFGSKRSLMDFSRATEMGQFIGMPITTIGDASTYIVTNYNGAGYRDPKADYRVIRPNKGISRIPLWKLLPDPSLILMNMLTYPSLRGGTAAPFYFRPQYIEDVGYVQDGGLTSYNNPVTIATEEVKALFPATPKPSIVVSLSTGSARPSVPQCSTTRRIVGDSYVARVFRAFMQQGNSERAWTQMLSHRTIGDSGEFFRFDVEYDGNEPSLDNIKDVEHLGQMAKDSIAKSPELFRLAHCIRAELFFFELASKPRLVGGVFECVGHILCRLAPETPGFEALMNRLGCASAAFQIDTKIVSGDFQQHVACKDGFHKEFKFHVSAREASFSITLRERSAEKCHVSGSPFTIDWLVRTQRLDAHFGRSDHQKKLSKNQVRTQPHDNFERINGKRKRGSQGMDQRKRLRR